MLLSMTGYGKAEAIINNKKIQIENKSLNSKKQHNQTNIYTINITKDKEKDDYM